MSDRKVVLITGASSGVGQSTARLLAQKGYRVFGTSRNPSIAIKIPGVELLALDVREDNSVINCVKTVYNQARQLDVLVNNAGYEQAGALEELSLDEAKNQFETNFFGVVRMVKAVLPLMRRQQSGQIINISSLAGLSPIPFMGIYSASKFALEGYTETLRHEVKPFNIHASQIEVGFLKSPMMDHRQVATQQMVEYDTWRERAFHAIREYEEKGPETELVAETVYKIITSKSPKLRYIIGNQAKFVTRFKWLLPEGAFEKAARKTFNLDGK